MAQQTQSQPVDQITSRRSFMAVVVGAIAAGVATALGRPLTVRAASQDMYTETAYNVGATTVLNNTTNANTVFAAHNNKWGIGISGTSDEGDGVRGKADRGIGVHGISKAVAGVVGSSTSGEGVQGSSIQSIGVRGETIATHPPAIWARSSGLHGLIGSSSNSDYPAFNAPTGVYGYATKKYRFRASPVGVYGDGSIGRGGKFKGDAAQLQLVPSEANTHPTIGIRGDFFVDSSGRLWFCKGATDWILLA